LLSIVEPTRVNIDENAPIDAIRKYLAFKDMGVLYQIKQFKANKWLLKKITNEEWSERLHSLEAQVDRSALFEDSNGYYTYSGLAEDLSQQFGLHLTNTIKYTKPTPLSWTHTPPDLRYFQEDVVKLFLQHKHAAVNLAVGMGKSYIALHIAQRLGLKTVVMVPFSAIANQLYATFTKHLGKYRVGMFGDGRKDTSKLITIAVAQSLVRVEEGTPEWDDLQGVKVLVSDESHMNPASTLEGVCMGLLRNAEYRFALSGTQLRSDGSEIVLKGLVGPIVYSKNIQDGVREGFLAKPKFIVYRYNSQDPYRSADTNKMTQKHLYLNPDINTLVANIVNISSGKMGQSVLVLIDEFGQFNMIYPQFTSNFKFAHGGATKANKKHIPPEFWKSEPLDLIEEFNQLKFPVMVGTSCCSTGADFKVPKTVIYLRGGKSEIDFTQSLGRGVRKFDNGTYKKDSFTFIDFWCRNVPALDRHAKARIAYMKAIGGDIKIIDI